MAGTDGTDTLETVFGGVCPGKEGCGKAAIHKPFRKAIETPV